LRLLVEKAGLELKEVFYNSTAFQFWGSEQYIKDVPLRSARSYGKKPLNSILSVLQLRRFEQKAKELNIMNQGDQAAFYLAKKE
jgi:hypothetical protein